MSKFSLTVNSLCEKHGGLPTSQIFQSDYNVGYGNCWAVFTSWLQAILPGGDLSSFIKNSMFGGVETYSKDQGALNQWAKMTTDSAKTVESLMNEIKKLKEDTYYQSLSTSIIEVNNRQKAISRRDNLILEYEKEFEFRNKKFEEELYSAPVIALSKLKIKTKKIISGPAKDLSNKSTFLSYISNEGIYGIYLRGTFGNHVLGVRVSNIDASNYSHIQYTWGDDVHLLNRFMDANSIEAQFKTKASLFGFLADYMKFTYNLEKPTMEEILKENFNPERMRYYHTYLIFKYET